MATLLDAPKQPSPAKYDEFVQKQLNAARRRVRVLDFFAVGLFVGVGSLLFLFVALMIDRYVETSAQVGYAVWGTYLAVAGAFIYAMLFRPARREINPYYAAREVEQTIPDAKNSLVTYIDLEDDPKVQGAMRTAISQKAAKDLKGIDLNRAIDNRQLRWGLIAGGVLFLANIVAVFLPPTRTQITLVQPEQGDITVFNNQDVSFTVRLAGRVPGPNDADAVRLRLWYNPDDRDGYEDRAFTVTPENRREFTLTIPAKQVRTGFQYQVLAGNAQTPLHTVICKILPEFVGFDVSYEYPGYLKRAPEQTNDPNLLAPYGTKVTLVVHTNRDVRSGHMEYVPADLTTSGTVVAQQPDAIQFTFTMTKERQYRVWFTTPEGDKNQDAKLFRMGIVDPKPAIRTFDIAYDYPEYLRWKPMTAVDVREPEVEAPRGTKVVVTAKTNRPVKAAQITLDGLPPVVGEPVPDQPLWVRFTLPKLDKDHEAKITFTPNTDEPAMSPRSFPIRTLVDQAPTVQLTTPKEDEITLPSNGTLDVAGFATDDHGVDKLTLRFRVVGSGADVDLLPKAYRQGMSFRRKEDQSWPTRVDYKDFVKLQDLRKDKEPTWRVYQGLTIEYWLEAADNCTIDQPNIGKSTPPKRIKISAPLMKPEEQKQQENRNNQRQEAQDKHERDQDKANKNDQRDVQQPPPKGADGQPMMGDQGNPGDPMMPPNGNMPPAGMPMPPENPGGEADPNKAAQDQEIQNRINEAENNKKPALNKPDTRPDQNSKVDPSETKPQPKQDPMGPPPAENRQPKNDPNKPNMEDMGMGGTAGEQRPGNVDKTKQDKGVGKPAGEPPMGMKPEDKGENKEAFGGSGGGDSTNKPDPQPMPMATGMKEPTKPEKGTARDNKPEPKDGSGTNAGTTKPERDVTQGDNKPPTEQPNTTAKQPPEAGNSKPQERPETGEARGGPKEDMNDMGNARKGPPKDDNTASENRPAPKNGMNDDQARGDTKGGPGQPQNNKEPGELDRELGGELDREINSPNPKVSDKAKNDVERLMRNKETRDQMRQKLDDLKNNAKTPQARDKADQLQKQGEQAAQNYDNEKPNQENLDQLAKKLNSPNEQERKDAEQRLNDWQKNAQAKKDLEKELDTLKKKNPDQAKPLENAMQKNEQANQQPQPGQGEKKLDPKELADAAKKLGSGNEQEKKEGQQKLEQMLQDPKTRQQAQDMLNEMAKNAQGEEKKNLQNAADKAKEMSKELAKNDPKDKPTPKDGQGGKPDPKDLEKLAKEMAGNDPKAKEDAAKKLQEMMNDPKQRDAAKEMMEQMAKNAKDEDMKKGLDEMLKQAKEMAKNPPKVDPEKLKELAKQMNNMDPKAKEEAKRKMDELAKDPKVQEQLKDIAKEMEKQAQTPEGKRQLEDFMNAMGGLQNPPDLGKPYEADPRNKLKAAELLLDKFKKNVTEEEFRKSLKWTDEQIAAWEKEQEAAIEALRKQVQKGDWRTNRDTRPVVGGGPQKIEFDPQGGSDPLRGGRYTPPSNYADAYKRFTEAITGSKNAPPTPKK